MTNYTHNFENPDLQPYADGECRHKRSFTNKGVLTCRDCGAVYDETLMEWGNGDGDY